MYIYIYIYIYMCMCIGYIYIYIYIYGRPGISAPMVFCKCASMHSFKGERKGISKTYYMITHMINRSRQPGSSSFQAYFLLIFV